MAVITKPLTNDEELVRYEETLQAFLDDRIDHDRFQSMRLQQGIYGQRQEGVNMVRIKVPAGQFNAEQAEHIADVVDEFSQRGIAHITTRQAIQVHYIPLEKTPDAIRLLAKANMTSREACNNTVRNITGCPLAGVCPHEHTDISPILNNVVQHFLRYPLTQHLPRKFKMSFSGCESDCSQAMIHDVGIVATRKEGVPGFKVLAGGGLGHKPRHAITVEEFIPEKQLLASMEAIISLHNRYSNRRMRAKSRIKFLVDKFGKDGFIEKYKEELARTTTALADKTLPAAEWIEPKSGNGYNNPGAPRAVLAQKQDGLNIFPIALPIGDITVAQLRGLAALMRAHSIVDVRTTQDQNLVLVGVPDEKIAAVRADLAALSLKQPETGNDVVACPGTSTCRLGITSSTILGPKLSGGDDDLRIRVSGCHNGCAQPETGDIGIYGEGKRKHGKLIPHYQMYLGGDGRNGGAIAIKGPTVPSARIESAIEKVKATYQSDHRSDESFFNWAQGKDTAYFKELLNDIATIEEHEMSDVMNDHGDESDFKVLQLGGGECSGAAQETVAANFSEAATERTYRNAFLLQRKYDDALECAAEVGRRVGQSLLFLAGEKPLDDLLEIGALLQTALPAQATLGQQVAEFGELIAELQNEFDDASFAELTQAMDHWTIEAANACQTIDQQLDLSASVAAIPAATAEKMTAEVIDLSTFGCPLHYIKARNELRKFSTGEVIDFLFTSGEPSEQVSSSLASEGHEILETEAQDGKTRIRVKKAG
ncbi:MAG: sulfurtransferase TusA family protein [Gammaproteobacteria bacterium]|nr:sulfurtransferase TusA family protein [Gammaproteobacteria bacterium]